MIYVIDNLSIAVHTFARRVLTSLSVDKILLSRYANFSTNFRGLPLKVDRAPSLFKHMHSRGSQCLLLLVIGFSVWF